MKAAGWLTGVVVTAGATCVGQEEDSSAAPDVAAARTAGTPEWCL
jgi:hypothetical protein